MTDTDKLKRLAETAIEAGCKDWPMVDYYDAATPQAILDLIAENEAKDHRIETQSEIIKRQAVSNSNICQQRDEAVALLRANMMYPDDGKTARETQAFLARIDAA